MRQPDNFADAVSRIAAVKAKLINGGYHMSDRDLHLANRLQSILLACHEAKEYYNKFGNLKEQNDI